MFSDRHLADERNHRPRTPKHEFCSGMRNSDMPEVYEPRKRFTEVTMGSQRERSRWLSTCHWSATPRRGDWTQQELCEFDRIRSECTPHSSFELQCSHTDEGDPWCIVWDRERELVVLHIARIDCRYVMARASHPKPLTVASLSVAINAALDELHRARRGPPYTLTPPLQAATPA